MNVSGEGQNYLITGMLKEMINTQDQHLNPVQRSYDHLERDFDCFNGYVGAPVQTLQDIVVVQYNTQVDKQGPTQISQPSWQNDIAICNKQIKNNQYQQDLSTHGEMTLQKALESQEPFVQQKSLFIILTEKKLKVLAITFLLSADKVTIIEQCTKTLQMETALNRKSIQIQQAFQKLFTLYFTGILLISAYQLNQSINKRRFSSLGSFSTQSKSNSNETSNKILQLLQTFFQNDIDPLFVSEIIVSAAQFSDEQFAVELVQIMNEFLLAQSKNSMNTGSNSISLNSTEISQRCAYSLAIGGLVRAKGSVAMQNLIPQCASALISCACNPVEESYLFALHGIYVLADSSGPFYIRQVGQTLKLVTDYIVLFHVTKKGLKESLGRITNALVAVIGPQLTPSDPIYETCRTLINDLDPTYGTSTVKQNEFIALQLQIIIFIQQLILFVPNIAQGKIQVILAQLMKGISSWEPEIRQVSISTLCHLVEKDPIGILKEGIERQIIVSFDKETRVNISRLFEQAIHTLLQNSAYSNPGKWILLFGQFVGSSQVLAGQSKILQAEQEERNDINDDDEEQGYQANSQTEKQAQNQEQQSQVVSISNIRLKTRLFVLDLVLDMFKLVGSDPRHFDLIAAQNQIELIHKQSISNLASQQSKAMQNLYEQKSINLQKRGSSNEINLRKSLEQGEVGIIQKGASSDQFNVLVASRQSSFKESQMTQNLRLFRLQSQRISQNMDVNQSSEISLTLKEQQSDFLVFYLETLVNFGFQIGMQKITALRLYGVRLYETIITHFANALDPAIEGTKLLEQYQAYFIGVLRSNLDPSGPPKLIFFSTILVAKFLDQGLVKNDSQSINKLLQLQIISLERIIKQGQFEEQYAEWVKGRVKVALLQASARLHLIQNSPFTDKDTKQIIKKAYKPYQGHLQILWMDVLKEFLVSYSFHPLVLCCYQSIVMECLDTSSKYYQQMAPVLKDAWISVLEALADSYNSEGVEQWELVIQEMRKQAKIPANGEPQFQIGLIQDVVQHPYKADYVQINNMNGQQKVAPDLQSSQPVQISNMLLNSPTFSWYFIVEFSLFIILKLQETLSKQISNLQQELTYGSGSLLPNPSQSFHVQQTDQNSASNLVNQSNMNFEQFMKSSSDLINRAFITFGTLQKVLEWQGQKVEGQFQDQTLYNVIRVILVFNEKVVIPLHQIVSTQASSQQHYYRSYILRNFILYIESISLIMSNNFKDGRGQTHQDTTNMVTQVISQILQIAHTNNNLQVLLLKYLKDKKNDIGPYIEHHTSFKHELKQNPIQKDLDLEEGGLDVIKQVVIQGNSIPIYFQLNALSRIQVCLTSFRESKLKQEQQLGIETQMQNVIWAYNQLEQFLLVLEKALLPTVLDKCCQIIADFLDTLIALQLQNDSLENQEDGGAINQDEGHQHNINDGNLNGVTNDGQDANIVNKDGSIEKQDVQGSTDFKIIFKGNRCQNQFLQCINKLLMYFNQQIHVSCLNDQTYNLQGRSLDVEFLDGKLNYLERHFFKVKCYLYVMQSVHRYKLHLEEQKNNQQAVFDQIAQQLQRSFATIASCLNRHSSNNNTNNLPVSNNIEYGNNNCYSSDSNQLRSLEFVESTLKAIETFAQDIKSFIKYTHNNQDKGITKSLYNLRFVSTILFLLLQNAQETIFLKLSPEMTDQQQLKVQEQGVRTLVVLASVLAQELEVYQTLLTVTLQTVLPIMICISSQQYNMQGTQSSSVILQLLTSMVQPSSPFFIIAKDVLRGMSNEWKELFAKAIKLQSQLQQQGTNSVQQKQPQQIQLNFSAFKR